MTTRDTLLQAAHDRQQQGQLAYYGALTPQEAYALLQAVGFRPDAAPGGNGPQALLALQVLFIAVPAVLMVAAAWVLRGYPLTPARHDAIRAALDARDGAPA